MTTPLPTPPSSSDPANFNSRADAFLAALPLFQSELDALAATLSPIGRNMLINGGFDINRRAPATNADDTYAHDRWNILTQTGTIAASSLGPGIESGYNAAIRLTQSQVTAQRFGFSQIVEQSNCIHARGGSGTLSGRVRCSAATTIRYAILGWTGTADIVTSDVVLSWTSATFTAGNFFLAANVSVLGTGSIAVTANAWTSLTTLTATLGTAFNNIVIFVWTDSAQAQNVTLDCDYMQFEYGANSTPFEKRSVGFEIALCQRYYWAENTTFSHLAILDGAGDSPLFQIKHPVQMRASPTLSVGATGTFFYNSGSAGTSFAPNGTPQYVGDTDGGSVSLTSSTGAPGLTHQYRTGEWSTKWAFLAEL